MQTLRSKLTYANVVASLALFLVLGGGAAFAASHLGKNSVGTKQLKKNSVTTAKIKKGAVTGAKINLGSLGVVPTANNANSLGGKPASAYAIRSASVFGKGTLIAELSDGIAQANVSHPNTGVYCFNGLSPAPKTAVAQLAYEADFGAQIYVQVNPKVNSCIGSQIGVATENSKGFVDEPFELIVH